MTMGLVYSGSPDEDGSGLFRFRLMTTGLVYSGSADDDGSGLFR